MSIDLNSGSTSFLTVDEKAKNEKMKDSRIVNTQVTATVYDSEELNTTKYAEKGIA